MMIILAVNAGSSSLKFQVLEMPQETVKASGVCERIGLNESKFTLNQNGQVLGFEHAFPSHKEAVDFLLKVLVEKKIVDSLESIKGVGHRVVHGGEAFKDSVVIDTHVKKAIDQVSDLAPLHNPANLMGIEAFEKALPGVAQVAVFDTAFHQTMPEDAYMYATPYAWYEKYQVRKYGFHGTSHKFVSQRAAQILNKPLKDTKLIVLHIGNGASLCAIKGGQSVDTSMGFTPLAGIPMGTRSGDIDPAIIEYIAMKENRALQSVLEDLNQRSGYLGVSGVSSDSRDLWAASEEGNKRAYLAVSIQAKMIADYIGAYVLTMNGVDAIIFTAGVGENAPESRALIAKRLGYLNTTIDGKKNQVRGKEEIISTPDSKVKLMVIPTNEEVMIARDTLRLVS
jgi:acetate kinase